MNVGVEKLPAGGTEGGQRLVMDANGLSSEFGGVVRSGPLLRVDGRQVAIKYRISRSSKCSVYLIKRRGMGASKDKGTETATLRLTVVHELILQYHSGYRNE